jgi:CRP/FNR family transcriptional regulator, cyclic AMP receptor protein
MALVDKYLGEEGKRLRLDALLSQKLVLGNEVLAAELESVTEFLGVAAGEDLIEQNGEDTDIYLIVAGQFSVLVNGRVVNKRTVNDHVGEMAAIEPAQLRAATVKADTDGVVAKVSEVDFSGIAGRHVAVYRFIARELSRRLMQRNSLVASTNDRIRVLIVSSSEALQVARSVKEEFDHDNMFVDIWTDIFRATFYTLEDLERKLADTDFVIAIAQGDDILESRDKRWPAPRDNVIFELALAMGMLGRHRAILMEPRDDKVKLPSDMAGLTTVTYKLDAESKPDIGAACNKLRRLFERGPR